MHTGRNEGHDSPFERCSQDCPFYGQNRKARSGRGEDDVHVTLEPSRPLSDDEPTMLSALGWWLCHRRPRSVQRVPIEDDGSGLDRDGQAT